MGWVATPSGDVEFSKLAIYPYSEIVHFLSETLEKVYTKEETKKLLYQNGKELFKKLEVKNEDRTY